MTKETIVISVGGSLIYPDNLDVDFLKKFKEIILKHITKGKRFVLVTGGGKMCRNYQKVAKELGEPDADDLDWIGIDSTKINAHLLKAIFKKKANKNIITNPNDKINFKEKVLIGAGWKPGNSTDYVAVLLAKRLKVKKLINLTNIDYVYDNDPKKVYDVKPIKKTNWKVFRKLFGNKWDPGLNSPFDPVASKEAEKIGLTVYIINGKNLENLDNVLQEKKFVGTTIR